MAAPSQEKLHKPFCESSLPVKSPRRMESRWISVVMSKSRQGFKFRVPVHRPADMLSMDRARPSSAASFPDRMAGEVRLIFWEIISVVRPDFPL